MDALELRAVHRQPPDHRARRHERPVEADDLLRRQLGRARVGVELEHARARQQLDVRRRPPVSRMDEGAVGAVLAAQVLLRRGRAVVGRMRLAADQQDRSVEAVLAQRVGGRRRGDAAADEKDVDRPVRHATDRTVQTAGSGAHVARRRLEAIGEDAQDAHGRPAHRRPGLGHDRGGGGARGPARRISELALHLVVDDPGGDDELDHGWLLS
jgi:hypothetical protein